MRIVIAGAGPAGLTVAETVRALDPSVEILMLSAEPHPPYSPPAMVDHFRDGTNAHFWVGEDWPERVGVDFRPCTAVVGIEADRHLVRVHYGERLRYDKLVVATGGRLHAPLPGAELEGVYNFKSLSAAEDLMGRVKSGEAQTAVVIGAGFIGMEIALLLSDLGVAVTQVEMLDQVMANTLDRETAAVAAGVVRRRDVDLRLETRATAIVGRNGPGIQTGDGRADAVVLEDGELLRADLIVAASGIRPTIEFLQGSGIDAGWGIVVDDRLRTSVPDVYAAGDAVETKDRLTGERYVHAILPNAVAQGAVVARNLLGHGVVYEGAERWNSLKHLGLPIVAVGLKEGDEVLRTRRDGTLRTYYLRDGRLVGFQLVGDTKGAGVLRALLNRGDDLRRTGLIDRLTQPSFGQGSVVGMALV